MTLENNHTFISPCNQRVTHINTCPHCKNGKATPDSYGFEYPTMASLVDAVISQEANEFPRCQYASGCSFDDIVWQQAIGALKNLDHSRRGRDMVDDEKVLFDLLTVGIVDHQEFNELHKWSLRSIRYSAVVTDHLWALYEAEHTRTMFDHVCLIVLQLLDHRNSVITGSLDPVPNDHLEAELNELKGQITLLNSCLLAVDHFSFEANKKVNMELEKDGNRLNHHWGCVNLLQEKHNRLVQFMTNLSDQMDLHRRSLIMLREGLVPDKKDTRLLGACAQQYSSGL
ncbi:hypothetical protein BDM02DRAFT_3190683 [Thelephora ganbajun]|uniref:Uncharacterized protein n=1 Tax=Thelephora ganbajun TaxID=370292 RepID=A0ACB6Z4A9_THEGA|nr:hypothetical protein BDM02DRAFT_3190683 [Thelephora ganbajun]